MNEAGGPRRNELRAAGGETFQCIAIDDVVDKDVDRREPRRQRCGPGSERRFDIDELVPVAGVHLVNQRSLVFLRAKHRDPHLSTTQLKRREPVGRGQDLRGNGLH